MNLYRHKVIIHIVNFLLRPELLKLIIMGALEKSMKSLRLIVVFGPSKMLRIFGKAEFFMRIWLNGAFFFWI